MDFIYNTCENLECLTDIKHKGEAYDYTTNLINSCLGLIVFPYAKLHSNNLMPSTTLEVDYSAKYGNISICRKGLWNEKSFEIIREHMYNAIVHGNMIQNIEGNKIVSIRFYDYNNENILVFDALITPSQLRKLGLDIAHRYLHENR